MKWSLLLSALVSLTACKSVGVTDSAQSLQINGAGATFPYPLYSKWFSEYHKIAPTVEINYQSIGSGGGIRQLLDQTVDFGASDAPMNEEQMGKASSTIVHIPTVLGAVVVTYNIPEISQTLKLNPALLAEIFMGKITNWSDPKIAQLNPEIKMPANLPILVVHRADGSGTSAIFTDYLSKVSPEWQAQVGAGTAVKWPAGIGGKGNEGVTGVVKKTPGSIGYVELVYAEKNQLAKAALQNKAGNFIEANVSSVSAAANANQNFPEDLRVSITNSEDPQAYPISGFTYLLVYQNMEAQKGEVFKKFLGWALKEGQAMAESLSYAPLPQSLMPRVLKKVETLNLVKNG